VKICLRFKIENELKKTDYRRLEEFLKQIPSVSVGILPRVDLEFISISPVVVMVEGFGYKIRTEILFEQPVGFEVFDSLKLDDEMRTCLAVNRRSFKLSRIVTESADFDKDLDMVFKTVERIVNHVCNRFGRLVEQTFTVNSEWLDRQLDIILQKEELEKRGEAPRSFGTIHAGGSKDAKERAGDLVPVYLERDKAYLYEDKKVFMLLPRNFVMKLLKLEGSVMMPVDQFTDEEREVLKQFSLRRYVKARKVGGKLYYCDLDGTTRKLLVKGMMKK
jgi:hypothetical protein